MTISPRLNTNKAHQIEKEASFFLFIGAIFYFEAQVVLSFCSYFFSGSEANCSYKLFS